ncbi:MAG: bifunctional tRNA (5-methylaminomethyl-2-thiouridine)(34)-methyltransferase MnmD/FAD-dependent 5-carboxymethylaminomethyl-2-thiouridine(34) oxidoreductase MnmC [Pseudomonadota bacterium]
MMAEAVAPAIEAADVCWRDGVPESRTFGDVYFNRDNGLEETRHVFIRPNQLAQRFARVADGAAFVIGETGFGTGLNFLAAWQEWRSANPPEHARLHFVSVERHPLRRADLQRALALWPELSGLAAQLIAHYPPLVRGAHRLLLDGGRVRLTLYFGDVLEAWRELEFFADAWFLDGFAPAVNPSMWLDEAMEQIRSHSKNDATLATFTSVGHVRRALAACGFRMSKENGFGRKREMLRGELAGAATTPSQHADEPLSVAIIGSGIAGCLLAANLASRGLRVTLIDAAAQPGAAASGNLQGALYVKLGVEFNAQTQLALSALLFSQRFYEPYRGKSWHPTGLFQMAYGEQERKRQQRFIERSQYPPEIVEPVTAAAATDLTGITVEHDGLWFRNSGWLKPAGLCHELSNHPSIVAQYSTRVQHITRCGNRWLISAEHKELAADRVVICGGHQSPALIPVEDQLGRFRFKPIRGQVTHLPEQLVHSPSAVICGPRYINPACEGVAVTGATFDLHNAMPELSDASQRENIGELHAMLPAIWRGQRPDESAPLEGRVGFRCTTHDYQPAAGSLSDLPGTELPGLFLLTGLGSKGLTYAPLLAEYLADTLTGEPGCLPRSLIKRVRPARCFRPAAADGVN